MSLCTWATENRLISFCTVGMEFSFVFFDNNVSYPLGFFSCTSRHSPKAQRMMLSVIKHRGHLMSRADSLEKTPMPEKIEGKRRGLR